MTSSQITDFLRTATDTDVELLLRRYLRRIQNQAPKSTVITFTIRDSDYDEDDRTGYWTMGDRYSEHTKGAILAEVLREFNRRCGFKSTLLQIEHDAETEINDFIAGEPVKRW